MSKNKHGDGDGDDDDDVDADNGNDNDNDAYNENDCVDGDAYFYEADNVKNNFIKISFHE